MANTTQNHSENAVMLLKANLGYFGDVPTDVELYLVNLLDYAFQRLAETAEIHLKPGDIYDDLLQVMYAAWLYRKGSDGAEKPPMLKEAIRDYQVGKAMATHQEVAT